MKKIAKNSIILSFLIILFLANASFVKAQAVNCGFMGDIKGTGDTPPDVAGMLSRLCKLVLSIAIFAIILGFILSGIFYVLAKGDPAGFTKANQFLLYSTIGAAVIFAATVILALARYIGTGE